MNKVTLFILLLFFSVLLYVVFQYNNKSEESKLADCLKGVLTTLEIDNIEIDVEDRLHSPIISGKMNEQYKKKFVLLITEQCNIVTFEDFINTQKAGNSEVASINFTLDSFNNIATITGLVNSGTEQQEILKSFTTAVQKHYGPWTIKHEILISKNVNRKEFNIDISLVFTAISLVKVTDIKFINNELIIKGLVRNEFKQKQTITQLNQLFGDELLIINQLQNITKDNPVIEKLDIDFDPIELLDINS